MDARQLRMDRNEFVKKARAIVDKADGEKRGLNEAEQREYDDLNTKIDEFGKRIENEERVSSLEAEMRAIPGTPATPKPAGAEAPEKENEEKRMAAFATFLRSGAAEMPPEQRALLQPGPRELRADMGAGSGSIGGYTVPQGFRNKIIETLKAFGGLRNLAEVLVTDSGQTLPWPTNDDTGNSGAIIAENQADSAVDPTFGQGQLKAYTFTSNLVAVSWELLQDTAVDIVAFLAKKLGQRLGRATAQYYATGGGTTEPQGAVTGATLGKTGATGQTASVIYDDLVDLVHSVDPAYRASGNGAFVMHDKTLAAVRKLKDTQGHPLWQPSVMAGAPDTLLGYRVQVDNGLAQLGTSHKCILFGDFSVGFVIRDVLGIQLVRMNEKYADQRQTGFFAFLRTDSLVQDSSAIKYYVNAAS